MNNLSDLTCDFQAYFSLGMAYQKLGRYEESISAFEDALGIDPSSADAFCKLGIAYKKLGLVDQAARSFRKSLQLRLNSLHQ